MSNVTCLSPDDFIAEAKFYSNQSIKRVRIKENGFIVSLRFFVPYTGEIIQCNVQKIDYDRFNFIELSGMIVNAD